MNITLSILLMLAGLVIGAAIAWLARGRTALRPGAAEGRAGTELATARSQLGQLQAENSDFCAAKAAVEATLESERRNTEEKLELLTEASEEMKAQFKALASSALESNNASFLQLAKGTLEKYQSEARGELEKREKAVETLVKPIAESLKQVDEHVRELEKSRAEAYGNLTSQVASLLKTQEALQAETGNLVKAMREPQARGRWGELQLRRCLELAGMLEYCDFLEQVIGHRSTSARGVLTWWSNFRARRTSSIDSKVPLTAYLAALEAAGRGHAQELSG